jgi:hypothetical protein
LITLSYISFQLWIDEGMQLPVLANIFSSYNNYLLYELNYKKKLLEGVKHRIHKYKKYHNKQPEKK